MRQHLKFLRLKEYIYLSTLFLMVLYCVSGLSTCIADVDLIDTNSHKFAEAGEVNVHSVETPLFSAVKKGQAEIVSKILATGIDPDAQGVYGRTALHIAARNCKSNVVAILLKYHANPNAVDDNGDTPLHLAARYGCISAAQLLIEKSANVIARDKQGLTPLQLAVGTFHEEIGRYFIQAGATYDIGIASAVGMLNEVKTLLAANPSELTHRGIGGWTPLHYAAAHGQTEVAKYLVEKGTPIDAATADGTTPLDLAAANGYGKTVEYLVQQKANMQKADNNGYFPIHKAVLGRNVQIIQLLLNSGANVNIQAEKGITPLHLAVDIGDTNVITCLLEHGANVSAKDVNGATPIKWAEYREAKGIVEMLREFSKMHTEDAR